jgi:hypothetical protein
MLLAFIGFIVLILLGNSLYYKYRIPKETNDMELFNHWIDQKLTKRYQK